MIHVYSTLCISPLASAVPFMLGKYNHAFHLNGAWLVGSLHNHGLVAGVNRRNGVATVY